MTTSEAVLEMRRAFDETQPDFAKRLGISFRSLCRYEAGFAPSARVFKKLADLAKEKNIDYLRNIFEAMLDGEMVQRMKRMTSGTSKVRVQIDELSHWALVLTQVSLNVEMIATSKVIKLEHAQTALRSIFGELSALKDAMEPYLIDRDLEQAKLLRQFRSELIQRLTPEGTLKLEGVALSPNVRSVSVTPQGGITFDLTKPAAAPMTPAKKPRAKKRA